jgi:hypothetical protein
MKRKRVAPFTLREHYAFTVDGLNFPTLDHGAGCEPRSLALLRRNQRPCRAASRLNAY